VQSCRNNNIYIYIHIYIYSSYLFTCLPSGDSIYIYIYIYYDRIARGVSEKHGHTKLHNNGAVHTACEHNLIKLHRREKPKARQLMSCTNWMGRHNTTTEKLYTRGRKTSTTRATTEYLYTRSKITPWQLSSYRRQSRAKLKQHAQHKQRQ